jgi:hypothetical protein
LKSFVLFSAALLCIVLSISAFILTADMHQGMAAFRPLAPKITQVVDNADAIEAAAGQVLSRMDDAAGNEADHWQKQQRELTKTVADVHDLLIHTDLAFNGRPGHPGLVQDLDQAIELVAISTHNSLDHLNDSLDKITAASDVTLEAFGHTADVASARMNDPQIDELLGHFNVLALHLDGIAENSEAMSGDMRLAVHRLAQPPTKFHQFLDAAWTTAKFGSLFVP